MSVLNPPVRTVLLVKIYLEVTDASVNPDILDETVKLVSFVLGFEISLGPVTFILPSSEFVKSFHYQNITFPEKHFIAFCSSLT